MMSKLDKFEQAIEDNIESWTTVSKNKRASIENIIQKANTDIVKKLKKRSFFWTIYNGESPTSILSHFLVGVCAPREVNFRQSSS